MANADSTIRVAIIGDAKGLTSTLDKSDKGLKGFATKAGGAVLGLVAVDKAFEFLQGATEQSDRLGDALTRLNISIGETDTAKLSDAAEHFTDLGLSKQDVLELAANFADLGKNAGIASPDIASFGDDVAATAAAISLLDNSDPSANVEAIGKAAGGSDKAMRALGISISETDVIALAMATTGKKTADSLTDGEKATARLNLVLDALKPKLDAAKTGSSDLEQSQKKLQAQVETLQGKLGGPLSDALQTVVGFINDEIDAIPGAVEGWKSLGAAIEAFGRTALGPLGNVRDALDGIIGAAGRAVTAIGGGPGGGGGRDAFSSRAIGTGGSDRRIQQSITRTTERRGGIGASLGGP